VLTLNLGPLALPVTPLLLLASVWLASALTSRLLRRQVARAAGESGDGGRESRPGEDSTRQAEAAGTTFFVAAALGLAAARLAHVCLNAQAYLDDPIALLDIRDGGWHGAAGFTAGFAWLLAQAWRRPPWRRALAAGALAGTAVWLAGAAFTGLPRGAAMPAVVLTPLGDTRTLTLREAAAGRPAVVNLWASWCGPCRQEMPVLAAAQQREPSVAFLFVNQGEGEAAVLAYLATLGQPLRLVLRDPGSQLGPLVGSRGLPTTLFYDAQGRLVHAHLGVLNAPALASRLRELKTPAR
jgi:thiol-disulfide isomerase/thioredoxin